MLMGHPELLLLIARSDSARGDMALDRMERVGAGICGALAVEARAAMASQRPGLPHPRIAAFQLGDDNSQRSLVGFE